MQDLCMIFPLVNTLFGKMKFANACCSAIFYWGGIMWIYYTCDRDGKKVLDEEAVRENIDKTRKHLFHCFVAYYSLICLYTFDSLHLTCIFYLVLTTFLTFSMCNYYCRMYESFEYRLGYVQDEIKQNEEIHETYSLAESSFVNFGQWFSSFEMRINLSYPFYLLWNDYILSDPARTFSEEGVKYRAGQLSLNGSTFLYCTGLIPPKPENSTWFEYVIMKNKDWWDKNLIKPNWGQEPEDFGRFPGLLKTHSILVFQFPLVMLPQDGPRMDFYKTLNVFVDAFSKKNGLFLC
eukprot:UN24524